MKLSNAKRKKIEQILKAYQETHPQDLNLENLMEELVEGKGNTTLDELLKIVSRGELLANFDQFFLENQSESGKFYTPMEWADYFVESTLIPCIENIEDYVVWDSAAGSGNLLVSYIKTLKKKGMKPKKVYASTIEESEIKVLKTRLSKEIVDKEVEVWKQDFLVQTPSLIHSLPKSLQESLEKNDKVLIYVNPPYVSKNAAKTGLYEEIGDGLQILRSDLFYQFLYQIVKLIQHYHSTNCKLALIGSGVIYAKKQVNEVYRYKRQYFQLEKGYMVNSNQYGGLSHMMNWAVYFELLTPIFEGCEVKMYRHTLVEKIGNKIQERKNTETQEVIEIIQEDIQEVEQQGLPSQNMVLYQGSNPRTWVKMPITSIFGKQKEGKEVQWLKTQPDTFGYILSRLGFDTMNKYNGITSLPIFSSETYGITESNFNDVMLSFGTSYYIHQLTELEDLTRYWYAMDWERWVKEEKLQTYLDCCILCSLWSLRMYATTIRDETYEGKHQNERIEHFTKYNAFYPFDLKEFENEIQQHKHLVKDYEILIQAEQEGVWNRGYFKQRVQQALENPNVPSFMKKIYEEYKEELRKLYAKGEIDYLDKLLKILSSEGKVSEDTYSKMKDWIRQTRDWFVANRYEYFFKYIEVKVVER